MAEKEKMNKREANEEILVFLHYFGGAANSWQWVTQELNKEYKCITFNFPGFGGTSELTKPSIENFSNYILEELHRLGIKKYMLIGHSMGGKIALQLAANAPQEVQRLILVAPSPPTIEPMAKQEKNRMLIHPDKEEAKKTVQGAIKQVLNKEKFELAVETQLVAEEKTWRWWLLEGMENSIAENIKQLDLPITILASEDDPVIKIDVIRKNVMPLLKGAELITIKDVGHLSPIENPQWIAAQIRRSVSRSIHSGVRERT